MGVYADIKQVDEDIYQALMTCESDPAQGRMAQVNMRATPADFSLNHMELLNSVAQRGDKQREGMLLDVMQRLKNLRNMVPFSARRVDPKKIDVILYELGNKFRLLDTDEFAQAKGQRIRQVSQSLLDIKKGVCTSAADPYAETQGFPPMDIIDCGDAIQVCVHIPGLKKEDVYLDVGEEGKELIISGDRKQEKTGKMFLQEIKRGRFERKVRLDCQVDSSKVESEFKEGN